jgi:cell shape-determining protein MreC
MIKKILEKIISFLCLVAVFGDADLISLSRENSLKKDTLSKNSCSIFNEKIQYKPVKRILSIKKSTPSLSYRDYNNQQFPEENSQLGKISVLINSSTSSVELVVADFEYTTDLSKIYNIDIDISEPKSFFARNSTEELKESIDFYCNKNKEEKII